jgi:hypothetical protein
MGVGHSSTCFFKTNFGFAEGEYSTTQLRLMELAEFRTVRPEDVIDIPTLPVPPERCIFNLPDQRQLDAGIFYEPALCELRAEVRALLRQPQVQEALDKVAFPVREKNHEAPLITLRNFVSESTTLHQSEASRGSVFQAAGQFNYLQFATPHHVPEHGITGYAMDYTQGPSCAMTCAAGTAYRNYLIQQPPTVTQYTRGQRALAQRNGLAELEIELRARMLAGGEDLKQFPWHVANGYVEGQTTPLKLTNHYLAPSECGKDLEGLLRVGVQQDTQVGHAEHCVTQVYCSAVSCGYSTVPARHWEPLASLVLRASYEATLLVGVKNVVRWALHHHRAALPAASAAAMSGEIMERYGSRYIAPKTALPRVYLTKVGGGVFGNKPEWIQQAILSGLSAVAHLDVPLDVSVVHFGTVEYGYDDVAAEWAHRMDGSSPPPAQKPKHPLWD